jgi:hypothetical protein
MPTIATGILSESLASTTRTTDNVKCNGRFTVSVSGTWVGTVTLDRSFDGGSTWLPVYSFTANEQRNGEELSKVPCLYSFNFTRTSGTAVVLLHAGPATGAG